MKPVAINVNGSPVSATVEPRTHLADFLRETQNLTGTHIGCEHGVCGACTVIIDGQPARSCITFAATCEGADVVTIEGLDQDEVAIELRDAFKREHGLQCGYCTPGMMVSARDIVLRMENPSEHDVRIAMSGNLCRCTGYVGITKAILSVIAARRARGISAIVTSNRLGPVGSGHAKGVVEVKPVAATEKPTAKAQAKSADEGSAAAFDPNWKPQTSFNQSFKVAHPSSVVWDFFGRVSEVAKCLPGATLEGEPVDGNVKGKIKVKVGPISADFNGVAFVTRDEANKSGTIVGSGKDTRSNSATRGAITYTVKPGATENETLVDVVIGFTLTGMLAQFSRSGLVQDVANRLIGAFTQNLEARLSYTGEGGEAPPVSNEFDAGSLMTSMIMDRIKAFFAFLFKRGR